MQVMGAALFLAWGHAGGRLFEVGACAEGPAFAGEDHYLDVGVRLGLLHGLPELPGKGAVDGVEGSGAIEADPENSVFLQFVYQRFLAHFCSSIEFTPVSGYDGLVFQVDDLLP